MNSEWAIIHYLLYDPSLVDRVYDLKFKPEFLQQEKTQKHFRLINNAWYKHRKRPLVQEVNQIGWPFRDEDKPWQTLEQAIENTRTFYLKLLIMERHKNGH